jgi:hypothetical protein
VQDRRIASDVLRVQFLERYGVRLGPAERNQTTQVASIACKRVRRQLALGAEVPQILLDLCILGHVSHG